VSLTGQEERVEELRDTHRLESKSQSDQVERLRKQAEETEALLRASYSAEATNKESTEKLHSEISDLKAELVKYRGAVKDEEEKRTKAIALLKTVRQKLVKAEKERDEVVREVGELREKDKADKSRERVEKARLQVEIEQANLEREKAVAGLRIQFDKEVALMRDKQERDTQALKGQFESEVSALKVCDTSRFRTPIDRIIAI
jgi:chromosome segregation ATPase